MKEFIGSRLAPVGDSLLGMMTSIPLGVVRMAFIAILAALAVWAVSLGPQLPEGEAERFGFHKDLRLFAVVLLALQAIPYLLF